MAKYRSCLPQGKDRLFMTDGGMETTFIFQEGVDLPCFAAFDLLKDDAGLERLRAYYARYLMIARDSGLGIVLESPTWRASADWGARIGYDRAALAEMNRKSIDLLLDLRAAAESPAMPVVVSGNLGPRGDGYRPGDRMTIDEARRYHGEQVATFAQTDCDMIAAFTMNYAEEAIGIAAAAREHAIPVAISFTVETNGRLPTGDSLERAITLSDEQTGGYPAYYMINCAHPTHFEGVLKSGGSWLDRIGGLRANASSRSHADLDESTDLDAGDPHELGSQYRALRLLLPNLWVVGGCCGTDHRHVGEICRALAA